MTQLKLPTDIQHWPLERLVPYENNARTHSSDQIEQLANSIREFGFTNPILVDSESGILAGHARLCAARSLDFEKVPVIVLDHLTDIQKRAYILADNQLALNAGWDDTLLAAELARLATKAFPSKPPALTMKHSRPCSENILARILTPSPRYGQIPSHAPVTSGWLAAIACSAAMRPPLPRWNFLWTDSALTWSFQTALITWTFALQAEGSQTIIWDRNLVPF
jgi:ParB-like nuclease domain